MSEDVFALAIMVGEKSGGFIENYEVDEGGLLGIDLTTDYLGGLLFEDIEYADRLGTLLNKATGQVFSIIRIPKERSWKNERT